MCLKKQKNEKKGNVPKERVRTKVAELVELSDVSTTDTLQSDRGASTASEKRSMDAGGSTQTDELVDEVDASASIASVASVASIASVSEMSLEATERYLRQMEAESREYRDILQARWKSLGEKVRDDLKDIDFQHKKSTHLRTHYAKKGNTRKENYYDKEAHALDTRRAHILADYKREKQSIRYSSLHSLLL